MSYKSSKFTGVPRRSKSKETDDQRSRKHSTSSSDCSYDSDAKDAGSETSTRRVATPSKGGADRRRVAIMQMATLRSRRGHNSDLTGLALVAPPDAAPTIYTHLTPPGSTPLTADYLSHNPQTATDKKYPSRDQDTKDNNQNLTRIQPSPDHAKELLDTPRTSNLPLNHTPMFSPVTPEIGQAKEIHIPVAGPVIVNLGSQSRKQAPLLTPSRINSSPFPDTSVSLPGTPTAASFLHYKPGVHSIAGPLPPPPRAIFNIDIHNPPPPRPPRLCSPAPTRTRRDLDAVKLKQNLQLPPSVTAVLSSKSSNLSTTKSYKEDDLSDDSKSDIKKPSSELSTATSVHQREGALSPLEDIPASPASSLIASELESTTTKPLESSNTENKETAVEVLDTADIPSVTVIEPPSDSKNTLSAEINHHKFSEWLKSNPELAQPLGTKRRGGSVDETHHKKRLSESPKRSLSDSGGSDAPSPPPKSFRNSLTANLKRISLPRTASLSSKSGRRWSSGGNTHYSSRTPSPSLHRLSPPPCVSPPPRVSSLPRFQKIRSRDPAALFCHEVHSQRTTSERCLIYAAKINELYLYDCGLAEWVINMKSRGPNTQHQRAQSTQPFAPQSRHTSRSSMVSEALFPRRPDASTATDLSQGAYGDITPTAVSLTLPYPSLAMNPPRTNPSRSNPSVGTPPSIRSLASSASISKSGGFFASLGRKTSLSKKERSNSTLVSSSSGSLSSTSGSGRFISTSSKHTATPSLTISRPINITIPPSVPGGPRAPHRRPQRSHTFTPSFPPASGTVNSDIGRRPSMFDLTLNPVIDIRADTEFYEQVDKLAGLLPHANRDVLAGYLKRAGQDMLAIGQYLEDEKNGTIQPLDSD